MFGSYKKCEKIEMYAMPLRFDSSYSKAASIKLDQIQSQMRVTEGMRSESVGNGLWDNVY